MKRSVLLSGAMSVAIAAPAFADDLSISTGTATAVETATAANSTPGNITITSSGSVTLTTTGAALTLNSNNSIINNGTITNSADASGVGVQIDAGNTGSFTNNGTINIPSVAQPPTSTGQFGVLLNGTGVFTGDVITTAGSTISITGLSANAISIQSELNGNVTLGGTINAVGQSSSGVLTSGTIDGAITNTGTITTARGAGTTLTLNANSPLEIGGSVAGGFLNVGPLNSTDTTAAGVLSTVGASPSLNIAPSLGLDAADLTLGVVSDAAKPGFSVINRGKLLSTSDVPGISATGILIGDATDNTSGKKTIFTGGFYNSGTISATANSDSPNVISSSASATTIAIGTATMVPNLTNDATGTISATSGGQIGGNTTTLLIQTGGSLAALNNAGSITSNAVVLNPVVPTLDAYVIKDMTGTLTSITNSGMISATATVLNSGAQKAVAADLSVATSPITFTNTGTVTGDILFGTASGSQLIIEGAHASVAGNIQSFGTGNVNIAISSGGTGGVLQTSHTIGAGTLTVGPGGTLNLGVGANAPVVSATGAVSFDAASHIVLTPVSILPSSTTIDLIHSDTGLSFGNLAATTAGVQIPFLFTGSLSSDSKNLILSLQRKTASELGLTGNAATIYQPALDAAISDAAFGGGLSALSTSADVQAAIDQLLPISSGAVLAVVETITDSNTNAIGARQRELLLAPNPAAGFSVWAQGLYGMFRGSDEDSYTGHGAGGVVGFDYSQSGIGHFGLALTIYDANLQQKSPLTAKTEAQSYLISPYVGFRLQNFFIDGQVNAGESSLQTTRTVNVGSLSRVATAKPDEMLASGGLSGGYVLNLGLLQLMPQISVNAIELFDHSYTETGGGAGVDLTVNPHHQSSVRGFAGLAAGAAFHSGDTRLVPQVLAGWSQELITGSSTIDAAFASTPNASFEISGPAAGRSNFIAGAGFDFVAGNWSVGLNYNTMIGSSATSQTAGLTMNARF